MTKIAFVLFVGLTAAVPAVQPAIAAEVAEAAPVKVAVEDTVFDAEGKRLGNVYALTAKGSPQVGVGGKVVTIPIATISNVNGKLTTSMTRKEVLARR